MSYELIESPSKKGGLLDKLNLEAAGKGNQHKLSHDPILIIDERRTKMKSVLVAVSVAMAIMGISMLGGCAGQKSMEYKALTGSEGMAKTPIDLGETTPSGTYVSGSEGAAKKGVHLGETAESGIYVSGSEGSVKKGVQHPESK